jgi:hypothetical protein
MIDYGSFTNIDPVGLIISLIIGGFLCVAAWFLSRKDKKSAKIDIDYLNIIDSPDKLDAKRKSDSDERSDKTRDNVRDRFRGVIDKQSGPDT